MSRELAPSPSIKFGADFDNLNSGRTDAEGKTAGGATRADENGIVMPN